MKKLKKTSKKSRNFLAISAHFRNSAGPIKSKKKWDDDNKKTEKEWLNETLIDDDLMYDDNEKELK